MPSPKKVIQTNRLTGKELLARVKELGAQSKTEKAKACGYLTRSPNGKECAQLRDFMNALLDAKGIQLDGQSRDNRGRSLSYRATVHKNGTLIISAGYTQAMGLNPGDRFEIKLGRRNLKLTSIDSEPSGAEFDDFAHETEEFDDDVIH